MMVFKICLFLSTNADYVHNWKSKGLYTSDTPLYATSLHSIKFSECKVKTKFNKDPLAVKQNNYRTKIVNDYIVYVLDNWSNNPLVWCN